MVGYQSNILGDRPVTLSAGWTEEDRRGHGLGKLDYEMDWEVPSPSPNQAFPVETLDWEMDWRLQRWEMDWES